MSIKQPHALFKINEDNSIDVVTLYRGATNIQLAFLHAEMEIVQQEMLEIIENSKKSYEINEGGEDDE